MPCRHSSTILQTFIKKAGKDFNSCHVVDFIFITHRKSVEHTIILWRWYEAEMWRIKGSRLSWLVYRSSYFNGLIYSIDYTLFSDFLSSLEKRHSWWDAQQSKGSCYSYSTKGHYFNDISCSCLSLLSWAPALAFFLILEFGNAGPTFGEVLTQYPLLFAISYWLICNNSAFNPLLYFIFIESFRQGLRTACSRCRVPRFSLQERRFKTGQELTRNRPTLDIINKEEGNIELKAYSGHNLWVGVSSFKYKTFVIYLCDHAQEYERRPLRLKITFECFPSAVLCKRK